MVYQYGTTVELYTLFNNSWYIFIPMCYPWEEDAKQAIVRLDRKHIIEANLGSKLLVIDDNGVKEKRLIFHYDQEGRKVCRLSKFLKKSGLEYEKNQNDCYCDGTSWNQKDSTSEIIYCQRGWLEHTSSKYWGEQYDIRFVDRKERPCAGGIPVENIRLNGCQKGIWKEMEDMFYKIIEDPEVLKFSDLQRLIRIAKPTGVQPCGLYMQTTNGYEWKELKLHIFGGEI
jgi:hypothetical protein